MSVRTATVGDAMVRFPKLCGPDTTVADAHGFFADDHVHALLVVEAGRLLAVVERADLPGLAGPARDWGGLTRAVDPGADLEETRRWMTERGRRRLAVIGPDHELLGLLCLKRTGAGFCSDDGIRSRREGGATFMRP
ncbi:hypothetical protein GCM10009836_60400 [Pseudonocardia ailaonensis]|uniref:CBS domain-containing protein n=1 Tax=Pseudonocardia ailaonensis TaxID=367279 RepID=A0ABN2NK19_9PSEU